MALISGVPIYGQGMDIKEDAYASSSVGTPSYPQEVIISCPNKNVRISSTLGGPLSVNVNVEWDEMFGGGMASVAGGPIGSFNNMMQWKSGRTLQQPWMNRKIYKNTKPFTFTLPLTFITPLGCEASQWVGKPCIALLSLCYPRKLGNGTTALNKANDILAESGINKQIDDTSLVGSFLNLFEMYAIPGPGLRYKATENADERGDSVNILAGNLFNLGACYVNSVKIDFVNSFDLSGCPIAAKAALTVTSADSILCDKYGDFNVYELKDNSANLDTFINACEKTAADAVGGLSNIFRTTIGFWSGGKSDKK